MKAAHPLWLLSLNCLPTQFSPLTYQTISPVYRDIGAKLNVVQIEKQKNERMQSQPGRGPPSALSTSLVPALKTKKMDQQCLQSTRSFRFLLPPSSRLFKIKMNEDL